MTSHPIDEFIARWQNSAAAERANYQLFLTELCHLLGVPQPQPTQADVASNAYVFEREGKIAWANRRKDPLYLFAALQRQLGYPVVPRPKKVDESVNLVPLLIQRVDRLEARLKLLEDEGKGGLDITKFYGPNVPLPRIEP